jgi:hypothetical protein
MDWLNSARECYEASTTYVDANYRKKWEYSLRAFQNEHAPGSKYLSADYAGRSKLFRPKTRSVIRKGEAAAFMTIGNLDDLNIEPEDPDNVFAAASAEAMKALVRHRLTKSINWPILVAGAYQDAASVGVVCSYNHWEYEQKEDADGMRRVIKDRPCIKLRPVENIRIDPSADWMDPVNSSPYLIDIIPMYVCDVREMMDADDPKTGAPKWKSYSDDEIAQGMPDMMDSTRQVRQGRSQADALLEKRGISQHDVVWVMKFFLKDKGEDWCFYTLGTHALLTEPKPVSEVYFHGVRPYTLGCVVLETHKAMPDGPTWMSRDLQREMNDNVNSRMDNVKLVLNKRYLVGRGRQVDIQSLLRNVPGGVTMSTDPKSDVVPLEWNDVTSSAYMEQDKLGQDFDDLVGNFTPNTRFANHGMSETLGGSKMAASGASAMTEYQIQTFVKTWVEPTLRQLVMLEQQYETDERIMALAGREMAKAFPQFGGMVNDSLLMQDLILTVDFGMGATNPETRLQKFLMAAQAANTLVQTAPPGANVGEMIKEVFRNAGYRNGSRFFPQEQGDPRLAKAFQMIQQLQGQLADKRFEIQANAQIEQMKIAAQTKTKDDETRVNAARIDLDADIRNKEVAVKGKDIEAQILIALMSQEGTKEDRDLKLRALYAKAAEADLRTETERLRLSQEKERGDREATMKERESAVKESNEARISQVADGVSQVVAEVGKQVGEIKSELQEAMKTAEKVNELQEALLEMARGVNAMASSIGAIQAKPKPTGWKKQNKDGKKSIVITFDNGDSHEMTEQ